LATLVLVLQGCASFYFHKAAFSPPPSRSLTLYEIPIREYWTGIVFNGSKIGFSHFRLASAAEEENRFDIHSEAYFRIRFLMLDKKINLGGVDRVAGNLSLIRFDYTFDIDGNHLRQNGQRLANQLAVTVRSRGESTRQVVSLETQIYPSCAIGLYPFLHGLEFSLIKCDTVISDPDRIHTLTVHIVNGIVYAPEFRGFLYHSWNESIVDGRWVAVDPTFGQIPVDATHIKLLEGQKLSDLMPLVDMIGKLKVRFLSDK
jgi:hypothetical protein